MRKFFLTSFAGIFALSLLVSTTTSADEPSPLVGVWVNVDPNTDSCPKIEIKVDEDGAATFFWWGKTHPTHSKYGPFPFEFFHKSVGDRNPATYGTATHENSFSEVLFTLEMDGGYMRASQFTKITDDSGRKPYCVKMSFKKE